MSNNKVRLTLHATKLKNTHGGFRASSPFAVVTLLPNDPREKPQLLGQTEVVEQSLNPKWTTAFDIDFELGTLTRINVGVYDMVEKKDNKPMGSAMYELNELLGTKGSTKAKKLRSGGTLFARLTSVSTDAAGRLEMMIRGEKLKNVEGLFGKSDPFFEISTKLMMFGSLTWQPIYRSKHIDNNLNPKWDPFSIDLSRLGGDFDTPLLFSVWDWQKNGKHRALGQFETSVNGLLAAKCDRTTSEGASKPFTILLKGREAGTIVVTHAKLEGVMPAASSDALGIDLPQPLEPPVSLSQSLTSDPLVASTRQPLSFSGAAKAVVAASSMTNAGLSKPIAQDPPAPPYSPPQYKYSTPLGPSAPPLEVLTPPLPPVRAKPTFIDYVTGGCELDMSIAIDFTGSNGDPHQPGTLHFLHQDGQLNDYEKAITAVGSIIARYDHNQLFPVYGFGAKYNGVVQHCFQVGDQEALPGIAGVLDAYRKVFRSGLIMSGPTVFAEVIDLVASLSRTKQESYKCLGKQAYTVLLILTDGAVSDIEMTKHSLRAACDAPLSIVIVGIGNADFSAMRFLDEFGEISNPIDGIRDICNFVEFNSYKNDRAALTRETLAEIPDQLVDYFYSRGIPPLERQDDSSSVQEAEPDEADIDLNVSIDANGVVSFSGYNGVNYDDSKYDSYSSYNPAFRQTQSPSGGFSPYNPYQSSHSFTQQAPPAMHQEPSHISQQYAGATINSSQYSSAPSLHQPFGGVSQSNPQHGTGFTPQYSSTPPLHQSYGGPPAIPATPVDNLFYVQMPPGAQPGMHLQVRNPVTQQMMIVRVPDGVVPGGKFGVRY